MIFSLDLFSNAIVSGILLGGFYCAVAVGITIAFGMLDIVNIAHPAFIMAGGFIAYFFNTRFGIDPLVACAIAAAPAYVVGRLLYRFYYVAFERRGEESLRKVGRTSGTKSFCRISQTHVETLSLRASL